MVSHLLLPHRLRRPLWLWKTRFPNGILWTTTASYAQMNTVSTLFLVAPLPIFTFPFSLCLKRSLVERFQNHFHTCLPGFRCAARTMAEYTYEEEFYTGALLGTCLTVRLDPTKGKGLYASQPIPCGAVVHEETALCCSQNMNDMVEKVPVCENCLVSLESPRQQLSRVTKNKKIALGLPYPMLHHVVPVRCLLANRGCESLFCSVRCREVAASKYHGMLCNGKMSADQLKAWNAFLTYDWVQDGIDFSDTALMSLRMAAQTLTSHRVRGVSLKEAFAPYRQLVRAPLSKFCFGYLLTESLPTEKWSKADLTAHLNSFLARQKNPLRQVVNQEPETPQRSKEVYCLETLHLLHKIMSLDEEERDFFTAERWSMMMGSVLLNGQERSPPSPYDNHRELVCAIPNGASEMKALEQKILQKSLLRSLDELSPSSGGQGIYEVGCLFNHSCEPNLLVGYSNSNDETLSVEATRHIAEGEELTISYIDTTLPFALRHEQLYEHYLFQCHCSRCLKEGAEYQ